MSLYTKEQYEKECEIARMVLRNVIVRSDDATMVANAKAILNNTRLFKTYVQNRLKKKLKKKTEVAVKQSSFARFMSWIPGKR